MLVPNPTKSIHVVQSKFSKKSVLQCSLLFPIGLLHSCYWGLGSGLRILISGPLHAVLGLANMFRISAIIGALVCIVFKSRETIKPACAKDSDLLACN